MGAQQAEGGRATTALRGVWRAARLFLLLVLPVAACALGGAWGLAYWHQPREDRIDDLNLVDNPTRDVTLAYVSASRTVRNGYSEFSCRYLNFDNCPGIDLSGLLPAPPPPPRVRPPAWSRVRPNELLAVKSLPVVEFESGFPWPVMYGAYVLNEYEGSWALRDALMIRETSTNRPVFLPTRILWVPLAGTVLGVDALLTAGASAAAAVRR